VSDFCFFVLVCIYLRVRGTHEPGKPTRKKRDPKNDHLWQTNTHQKGVRVLFVLIDDCKGIRERLESDSPVGRLVDPLPHLREDLQTRRRGVHQVAVREGHRGERARVPVGQALGLLHQVGNGGEEAAARHVDLRPALHHADPRLHHAL
jgi:hypothetical protein